MTNEYKITTLLDIAALEDDQIDRLCAELPSVLKQVKAIMALLGLVDEVIGETGPVAEMLTPLTWVDDGKQDITATMYQEDGEEIVRFETKAKEI